MILYNLLIIHVQYPQLEEKNSTKIFFPNPPPFPSFIRYSETKSLQKQQNPNNVTRFFSLPPLTCSQTGVTGVFI